MFNLEDIKDVLNKLKDDKYFAFCNEAHFQMSFINACYLKEFNKSYEFIPEYPIEIKRQWYKTDKNGENIIKYYKETEEQNDPGSVDLLIVDKATQERTVIEFKYLTINRGKLKDSNNTIFENAFPFVKSYEPSNMLANDQRRFDCWSDIERIERLVKDSKINDKYSNGYLILITNDEKYWNSNGTHKHLTLKEGSYDSGDKEWTCEEDELLGKSNSFGTTRMRKIVIRNKYVVHYDSYHTFDEKKFGEFKYLVLEINQ